MRKWFIDAIQARDYPVLQGSVLIIATIIIVVNLTVAIISTEPCYTG